jgi:hypothetical protein
MSPDTSLSHITQPPISRPSRHYLVTPMMFLVLICAQNLHDPCLQSSFTCVVKKFWSPSLFTDPESCHHWPNFRATATHCRTSWGRAGGVAPSQMECKIPDWAPKLLELKTFRCRKQTYERQRKSWQGHFFWSEGCKPYSLQLSGHMSTKWLTVALHYIPDAAVLAPYLGFVQVIGSQFFSIG